MKESEVKGENLMLLLLQKVDELSKFTEVILDVKVYMLEIFNKYETEILSLKGELKKLKEEKEKFENSLSSMEDEKWEGYL